MHKHNQKSMNIVKYLLLVTIFYVSSVVAVCGQIDRKAVVTRNNPKVILLDSLQSLTVGNGGFAFTADATGLQTFPEKYEKGVCLGTMSDWGWHSFANLNHYRPEDAYIVKDFGRGHKEIYSAQFKTGRQHDASEWLRKNPHRLHLGTIGLNLKDAKQISNIHESLDLWTGTIQSTFNYNNDTYNVKTVCSPVLDKIASSVVSSRNPEILIRFAYPTGGHSDDACDWNHNKKHNTEVVSMTINKALLKRTVDATVYYLCVNWTGTAKLKEISRNNFVLKSDNKRLDFTVEFSVSKSMTDSSDFGTIANASANYWQEYWNKGGIVDFSHVRDSRARELERRIVLSQYLMATNDAGETPPQETGLTYNSWFGKFHLEMIWWHQAQFALWGHSELLDRSLSWYGKVEPIARSIAKRQGFDGVRWMKMTDPSGAESPSNVGSYLIWQQPHLIYLSELLYRCTHNKQYLKKYGDLVEKTAEFMYSFAEYDKVHDRYILRGCIPAQETLDASKTVNSPYELSYWHYTMLVANRWRELRGLARNKDWDRLVDKLSPLAFNSDSLYLASETATDTYTNLKMTSDHPALLGALGVLPDNKLVNDRIMSKTLDWIFANWNWPTSWGWDFPMTAMTAARLGRKNDAVKALLMPMQKNKYLINGHNYQDDRLRIYLPGNGGLLTAVAMMCAGWDGSEGKNPGFPNNWDVRWEGLNPMP